MDDLLTATPLCGLQVQRAYVLVGLMHPQITAQQWATYARRCARIPARLGGLIGIQDRRGYVHAVFHYAVDRPSLDGTQALRLYDFILAHLPGRILGFALATCAEHLATEFGCTRITVDLPATATDAAQDGSTRALLQSAGFNIAGVKLVRTSTAAGAKSVVPRQLEGGSPQLLAAGGPFQSGQINQPCSATAPG
jgi:hypothetical protein